MPVIQTDEERKAAIAKIDFKSVVETVREPLLVLDGRLRVVSANMAFYRLFRVAPEETVYKPVYELGSGQWNDDGLRHLLDKVIPSNEQFQDYEVEYDFPVIGYRAMLLNGRKIEQGEGREQLILLAIEDVTERKRAEKALAETVKLVDNSPDIVARYDPGCRYLHVNKSLEEHLGRSKEEIIGRTPGELGVKEILCETFKKILKTRRQTQIDIPLGDRIYQAIITPETDAAGNIVSFTAHSRDITDIRRTETALREGEEKYRTLVERANDGIIIVRDGIVAYANPKMAELDGSTVELLVGSSYIDHISPGEIPKLSEIYRRRMAREKVPPSYETVLRRRDGRDAPATVNASVITFNGKPADMVIIHDISEQKRVEKALRESEERYRTLVEASPDAVTYTDNKGRIIYVNKRTAEMHGYGSEEEITGVSAFSLIDPADRPRAVNIMKRAVKEDIVENIEYVFLRKDGSRFPAELSVKAVRDAGGGIAGFVAITRDITERKKIREELSRRETEFRTLAENSPDIVVRYGRDCRFLYANPKAEPIFGHPPAELIGKRNIEIGMPKKGADYWEALIKEVVATKKEKEIEFRFPPGERFFSTHLMPEFDKQGNVVSVLSISRDITELKKDEETLRRNEYFLRTLVENSPDLIFRVDNALRYMYINPAYERVTGIAKERFAGKTNEELGMPLPLAEFWRQALRKVIDSGREYILEFDMEGLFGKRYFTTRLIPEFARSGLVDTILALARDITERKQAEEKIRYISFHDKVTGLFNRSYFEEEVRRIDTERDLPISIIMGDINNLKLTNDVLGHQEGDKLLVAIAGALQKACRKDDVIARWGGDEFAVILPRTDASVAGEVCYRIVQFNRESKGTVIQPSIAMGIATKDARDRNIYQTIRQAEQAMYDNKLAESERNEKLVLSSLLARAQEMTQDLTEHAGRAHELARHCAGEMGLDENQMEALSCLIELHDIGEAVIPREILTKPGRLSEEEWERVKRHPEAGFRVVKSFPDTAKISDEVLAHEERWDGTGYPRGLKGKDIPYLARVFAVIEAYDVMTHPRPYDRALTREEAREELRRNAGKQFDPELVDVFLNKVLKN